MHVIAQPSLTFEPTLQVPTVRIDSLHGSCDKCADPLRSPHVHPKPTLRWLIPPLPHPPQVVRLPGR